METPPPLSQGVDDRGPRLSEGLDPPLFCFPNLDHAMFAGEFVICLFICLHLHLSSLRGVLPGPLGQCISERLGRAEL